MTPRTALLVAAAVVVPALWGWLVPAVLARLWPRRRTPAAPRPPLPDYEI